MLFFVIIYLGRYYGPEKFGIINFSSVFVTYFSMISYFGIQNYAICCIVNNKVNINYTFNEVLSFRIIMSLVAFVSLIIVTILLPLDSLNKFMIYITGCSLLAGSIFIDWFFNGLQEMKVNSVANIIKNLTYALIAFIFIYFNIYNDIKIVPIAFTTSIFLASIYLLFKTRKYNIKYKFTFQYENFKLLMKNSLPFFFSGVFATINCNVDTIMLGIMQGNYAVGLYSAVYKIVNILIMFVSFIFTPVYPVLIEKYHKNDLAGLKTIIKNLNKIVFFVAIPLIMVSFVIGKEVILTLYKAEYLKSIPVFTILISYVGILYIREIYGYQLAAYGMQKKYMKIVMISSSFNIVSNLIFIPIYSINAAAINTLISEIINIILMRHFIRKEINLEVNYNFIIKYIIAASIMDLVIVLSKLITINGIMLSVIGIMTYVVAIFLTKAISIEEIRLLLRGKK